MKKLFALLLAMLMLLSLCACGKSNEEYKPSGDIVTQEEQLMPGEAGKLTIYGEADIQLVYNTSGNVIAVSALNQQADSIASAYDFAEKTCTLAVLELIDQILDSEIPLTKGFILIRQEPGSEPISDDFLTNIQEDAQANKGEYPVIVTGAKELSKDGLFNVDTALLALKLNQPSLEGATLSYSEEPVGGSYSIFCTDAEGNTKEYAVGAVDGSVTEVESSQETEQADENATEPVPESDVFDPIPDTEANKGTDGGVDNGSVNFD